MLIITRRPGERIMIGEDMVICVLEASGGTVRIGVQAPRSTPVFREEVLERRSAAAAPAAPDR